MNTLLSFDYGQKKIGTAISRGNIALRLPYIATKSDYIEKIRQLVKDNQVESIIIGIPLSEEEHDTKQTEYVRKFIENVKNNVNVPVIIIEESLTTKIALNNLRLLGFNKDQIQNEKDSESARILLQEYLDSTK